MLFSAQVIWRIVVRGVVTESTPVRLQHTVKGALACYTA